MLSIVIYSTHGLFITVRGYLVLLYHQKYSFLNMSVYVYVSTMAMPRNKVVKNLQIL